MRPGSSAANFCRNLTEVAKDYWSNRATWRDWVPAESNVTWYGVSTEYWWLNKTFAVLMDTLCKV